MKIYKYSEVDQQQFSDITARANDSDPKIKQIVLGIIDDVKKRGDQALVELTRKFDYVEFDLSQLKVIRQEIDEAYVKVDAELIESLKAAKANIEAFNQAQLKAKDAEIENNGVELWREFRPIEKIGLYVPGGKAAYPSTVLMLAMPAKVAGSKNIIITTPVSKDGKCNPAVLVAADICGVTEIYKIGGAQAIAAMAYGTATIPKVYKIFGPGNSFVTEAKMAVFGSVNIDIPAGPSECMVISDTEQNSAWIAADLLSQLEHAEDSQAGLVTFSKEFAIKVIDQMKIQMQKLSRKEIIEESLKKSFAFVVDNIEQATQVANEYAPEHLEIVFADQNIEKQVLALINNAGSIFLGPYSSEPLGDYATGSNHTLPTSAFAKMFEGLSVENFGKRLQVQRVSKEGIGNLRNIVKVIGTSEGLDAHVNSVEVRFGQNS